MTDVVVPRWGLTMEEAVVNRWLKAVGDPVDVDEPLLELSTDKVENEVASPATGRLVRIDAPDGAEVTPGQVIGEIVPD